MDKTALTIFAPIDKSLADLLAKSKSRSINLAELAKHHIGKSISVSLSLSLWQLPLAGDKLPLPWTRD